VLILKLDKVACFQTLLQVLILNSLYERICTKIVQDGACRASIENKELKVLAGY
jgi:hypothetical protein